MPTEKIASVIDEQLDISSRERINYFKRNKFPILSIDNNYSGDLRLTSREFTDAHWAESELMNALREEYVIVRDAWSDEGIDCMLIKSGGLEPSFPYLSDNIDILVRPENEEKARKILIKLGYIELRNIEEPQKFLFRKFKGGKSVSAIHLHTQVGWLVGFMDEKALWQRCRRAPDDDKVLIPSPEDTILITTAHSFYENKRFRLADVARIRECWKHNEINIAYMEKVANKRGWLEGLYFGLLTIALLEKQTWDDVSIPLPALLYFGVALKCYRKTHEYYMQLTELKKFDMPFNLSFLFSKKLYYKKIMHDKESHLGEKLFNVVRTLAIGIKLKSGIRPRPSLLVSFSGPDGSGKTQLAETLRSALDTSELNSRYFWSRCATSASARLFSRLGKAVTGAPREKAQDDGVAGRRGRLKNPLLRLAWSYITAADMTLLYLINVRVPMLFGKIVICDRYVYDAAAEMKCSLEPGDWINRLAIKIMLALAPKPNIAYLLDLPLDVCAARKDENTSLEYLKQQKQVYIELASKYGMKLLNTDRDYRTVSDEIVPEVMTSYLDNFETWLNWLFMANSSQLNPDREMPVKVLFLTNMYPTPDMPSFGTFVQDQEKSIRREGVKIDILLINGRKSRINYFTGILRFWKQILTRDYDVIHAHYFYSGIIARLQTFLPVVLTHHGPEVFMTWERFPARFITPFMEKIILVSPEQKLRLRHKTAEVIPCGVDFKTFQPVPRDAARKKLNLPLDKKLVLWAGEYFRPVKRWDIVQAAIAEAKKQDPQIELILLSGKPHAEVPLYMSACDALLLVSDGEGSPMVVKEAMACNLPIVAFPTGDVAEVVGGTKGCFLCSQEPVEVAGKICLAVREPQRSNGRERIVHLEQGAIARRIISVYCDAMRRNTSK